MKIIFYFLSLFFIGFGALAQETDMTPEQVKISIEDCHRLLAENTKNDATYKPGVNVRGEAVAPADISPVMEIFAKQTIDINFGIDIAKKYFPDPNDAVTVNALLATVSIDAGNKIIEINGKPLDKGDSLIIKKACKMAVE